MKIDLKNISNDIQLVGSVVPQLAAAYAIYRTIWTAINPGKTEQEFEDHLTASASAAVSAADAILLADGFTRDVNGNWTKVQTPA